MFITIDTEEDLWGNYQAVNNPVDNIFGIPTLQALFDRYGAVPTYLVNYPVADSHHAVQTLRKILDKGRCEIGTHCHPWNTPPFEEEINQYNSMMCNLPHKLVMRKIETLHEKITERFQVEPKCFRAGRWGIGSQVAEIIRGLGYRIDTSVSPHMNWVDDGGVDFRKAPTHAYRFEPGNILLDKPGGPLLEVPPTIGFFQKNFKLCNTVRQILMNPPFRKFHLIGILDRLNILNFRWLSPELSSGADMIHLSKNFIRKGYRLLNMSFHSTSLLPGKSPFVRDQQELETFLNNIEMFLKFAADEGMKFAPLPAALDDKDLFASR